MIYDSEIQTLETEKAELQAKHAEYGAEITRAKTTLRTSTDLKAIKTATATKEAAVTARGNIERRIAAIETEVGEWRFKQRAFKAEFDSVPTRLTALRERLANLQLRRVEQAHTLSRLGANLEKTERQFSQVTRRTKPADLFLIQDRPEDPAAYAKSALKDQRDHQATAVNDLTAALAVTEKLIIETEAAISRTETYLEELRCAA